MNKIVIAGLAQKYEMKGFGKYCGGDSFGP